MAGRSQKILVTLQWEDETLKPLFAKVGCTSDPNVVNEQYVLQNDVLYVQTGDVLRLIVPLSCRPLVFTSGTYSSMGRPSGPTQNIHTHQFTILLANHVY